MMTINVVVLALFGVVVSMTTVAVLGSGLSADNFPRIQPRVIGGAEVLDRCRPPYNYIVALQFTSTSGPFTFCSGVLLTDSVVVTSGYCALQISLLGENPIDVVLGERDMLMRDVAEQRISVESYKFHPGYNATTYDNNIALIRLSTKATFSSCVMPAVKVETDTAACDDLDQSCLIAGWGPYAETGKPTNSRLPRYASVTVFGDLVTSLWSRFLQGQDPPVGSLYAEAINPKMKACFFDWGGIVSCLRNGKYALRGVIGEHNCNTDVSLPILVTNIEHFQTWIDRCVNNWTLC